MSENDKIHKFQTFLNKRQEILIAKTIGCNRFVSNRSLAI
ncbi:helix-turn-helix domain-containing protein (plasmid) [Bacillus cereus]|nr:helix-turn-helix domain-containing protein [Bacillus cereus]